MMDLKLALRQHFGYTHFLPGQEETLSHLMNGRSVLAVMATGGGKSLCYQLPAYLLDGLTVVVSPLVALMQDQVNALTLGNPTHPPAVFLNSTLSRQEREQVCRSLQAGRHRMLYIAPEQLRNRRILHLLKHRFVSLLAVDEAHCISEWGHDFRPDYLALKEAISELHVPRVLALTATATPLLRKEIPALLGVSMEEVITGFDRPNLRLEIRPYESQKLKETFRHLVSSLRPPGLIYTNTRHDAERIARLLIGEGYKASCYHAGMDQEERKQVQQRFLSDELEMVSATSAFGLGIDKPDIRFVLHIGVPETLERYYQEAGRAGRDGLPSRAGLLYATDRPPERMPGATIPSLCEILQVYHAVLDKAQNGTALFTPEEACPAIETDAESLPVALSYLEKLGLLHRQADVSVDAEIRVGSPAPSGKIGRLLRKLEIPGQDRIPIFLPEAASQLGIRVSDLEDLLWDAHYKGDLSFMPGKRLWAVEILRQDISEGECAAYRASSKESSAYHRKRWDGMRAYIAEHNCRHRYIRRFLGEKDTPSRCDACDNCVPEEGVLSPEVESLLQKLKSEDVSMRDIGKALLLRDARLISGLHPISFDLRKPLPLRIGAGIAKMWLRLFERTR